MLSQNAGDAPQCAMAPIVGTTATYSSINGIAQAANSCQLLATAAGTSSSTSLMGNYSFPDLLGIPESLYSGNTNAALKYNTTPNHYLQVGFYNTTGQVTQAAINILYELEIFVELYGRVDVALNQ